MYSSTVKSLWLLYITSCRDLQILAGFFSRTTVYKISQILYLRTWKLKSNPWCFGNLRVSKSALNFSRQTPIKIVMFWESIFWIGYAFGRSIPTKLSPLACDENFRYVSLLVYIVKSCSQISFCKNDQVYSRALFWTGSYYPRKLSFLVCCGHTFHSKRLQRRTQQTALFVVRALQILTCSGGFDCALMPIGWALSSQQRSIHDLIYIAQAFLESTHAYNAHLCLYRPISPVLLNYIYRVTYIHI